MRRNETRYLVFIKRKETILFQMADTDRLIHLHDYNDVSYDIEELYELDTSPQSSERIRKIENIPKYIRGLRI